MTKEQIDNLTDFLDDEKNVSIVVVERTKKFLRALPPEILELILPEFVVLECGGIWGGTLNIELKHCPDVFFTVEKDGFRAISPGQFHYTEGANFSLGKNFGIEEFAAVYTSVVSKAYNNYEEQSMTDFKLAAVEERKADLEEFKYRFSFIPEFLKDVKEFDEGLQKICKEGNCFTTLGLRLLDSYIELLGEHFGVSDEDLYWHIYDNDLGRLKKSLRVNGKEFVIGSAGDLFKALKTTEK